MAQTHTNNFKYSHTNRTILFSQLTPLNISFAVLRYDKCCNLLGPRAFCVQKKNIDNICFMQHIFNIKKPKIRSTLVSSDVDVLLQTVSKLNSANNSGLLYKSKKLRKTKIMSYIFFIFYTFFTHVRN